MRGFHILIFNLFAWLLLLSPQEAISNTVLPAYADEVTTTSEDHQPIQDVIELGSRLIQIFDTSQNNKLPLIRSCDKDQRETIVSYEPKLLYLPIGNAIELQLSSTTIIFPFHCFT